MNIISIIIIISSSSSSIVMILYMYEFVYEHNLLIILLQTNFPGTCTNINCYMYEVCLLMLGFGNGTPERRHSRIIQAVVCVPS